MFFLYLEVHTFQVFCYLSTNISDVAHIVFRYTARRSVVETAEINLSTKEQNKVKLVSILLELVTLPPNLYCTHKD